MELLEQYSCYTLFDLHDRRNWDTMLQIISMRAQPIFLYDKPKLMQADLGFYSFGSRYKGLANIWMLEFAIEARDAFREGEDPVFSLMQDSVMVPMTVGLHETVQIDPACIITNSELRNTYFMMG